jgi:alkanesulfonate monooxygenase SsuD/methylene tetrahydromethanopterin reductase-like flavin-dependent oxidoreductase (luciferase family)
MDFGYHQYSFIYADEPDRPTVEAMRDRVGWLDDAGFSVYSVQDHFWQLEFNGYHDETFFDSYTLLPWVAGFTDAMRLTPVVACVHYRNPAYLGRIVSTLDHLSGGRAILGIGAGWYEDEYDAYDVPYPDGATRVRQLRDAIELIKAMWTESSPVSHEGRYYDTEDLYLDPKPVQDPYPPVLVGGQGEQLTLRVVAHHADSWNAVGNTPESFAHKLEVLWGHCEDLGTDYDAIEKTILHTVFLRDSTEQAHEDYERLMEATETGPEPREERNGAIGTPEQAREYVQSFADAGADTFMIKTPKNDRRSVELFVDEVMPAF